MNLFDFKVQDKSLNEVPLSQYQGKVLLIVNTASACGFTPQYEGLQKLYETYRSKGFEVLAFPCNQFGAQEKGTNDEIQAFCTGTFGLSFPVFAKIDVNGKGAAPLYDYLKKEAPGIFGTESIKWNFTKFLISREGKVLKRYAPKDKPEDLVKDIEAAL